MADIWKPTLETAKSPPRVILICLLVVSEIHCYTYNYAFPYYISSHLISFSHVILGNVGSPSCAANSIAPCIKKHFYPFIDTKWLQKKRDLL